jgi:hypothetical protein
MAWARGARRWRECAFVKRSTVSMNHNAYQRPEIFQSGFPAACYSGMP